MRLQLIAIVAVMAVGPARADPPPPEASATLRIYADDDRVTVVSPAAHAGTELGDDGWFAVDATIDVVSAASVDVITAASSTEVSERRIEGSGRLGWTVADRLTLSGGLVVSHENDYDAWRAELAAARELDGRLTTIEVRVRGGRDHTTDVTDPGFSADRDNALAQVGLSRVIDARTVADATVELSWSDGWHGSSYRRVVIDDPDQPVAMRVPEVTPARRLSAAASVGVRRAVGAAWFASGRVRGYVDEWAMTSATLGVELKRSLAGRWLVGVQGRGYLQDGARFWESRYQPVGGMAPTWRTADRTLGPMASAYAAAVVERSDRLIGQRFRWIVAGGGLQQWFFDYEPQSERRALMITATAAVDL